MSENRKDSKGRVLRNNEYQKKDGRYEYRFTENGIRRSVYSWRLIESDPAPKGKKAGKALRTMEKEIQKDLLDGIKRYESEHVTLNNIFEVYIEARKSIIKPTTYADLNARYNRYIRNYFGSETIKSMTASRVLEIYTFWRDTCGATTNSIWIMHALLSKIFKIAVAEDLVRKNPCDSAREIFFGRGYANKYVFTKSKKKPLTDDQINRFLQYIEPKPCTRLYSDMILVALNTGLRPGELTGLQWENVDFKKNLISVRYNLVTYKKNGKWIHDLVSPKTPTSYREIPMIPIVRSILLRNKQAHDIYKGPRDEVSGHSDFVFVRMDGSYIKHGTFNAFLARQIEQYNAEETALASQESREPDLLPNFTPHLFRHTFATRLNESGLPISVIQKILGHSSIATTMDVYVETSPDFINQSMLKWDGILPKDDIYHK